MMMEEGAFSIINSYLRLAGQGENILGFRADEYYWRDLGRLDDLQKATRESGGGTVSSFQFLVSGVLVCCGSDLKDFGGPGRDRTDDLFHAMEARSQLRHRPT